jgi:uncharacterized protein (TIGR02466 family)
MSAAPTSIPPTAPAAGDTIAVLAREGRLEPLFATPVFWHICRDVGQLNAQLRERILVEEARGGSQVKSNQGGWQSTTDVFGWGGEPVAQLKRIATAAVEAATARLPLPSPARLEIRLSSWAAVNRRGHYNTAHVHPLATWSGIYYVDPGDDPADGIGGALELLHPVTASAMTFFPGLLPSARIVRPEAGMVILFPSYLQHGVRLYQGERPRICVPFNAHTRIVSG